MSWRPGAVAIAGIGATAYSKNSGVSTLTLALQAVKAALDDAGLGIHDVDGVATHTIGDSVTTAIVAQCLGIRDLRLNLDQYGGGGTSCAVVGNAALAVSAGLANVVVCYRAINARSGFRMGGLDRPPLPGVEAQYQSPYGYVGPPQQYALVARAYLDTCGVKPDQLGHVAIAQREYAIDNPKAMMRRPLTLDEYLAAPFIADPLRLFDCCLETDVGVALVLTAAERARDLQQVPVLIDGFSVGGGHMLISNRRDDLSVSGAKEMAPRLFRSADVTPDDIDVAEIYDAFTPLVLIQLEDYGFCGRGEAADFVVSGQTRRLGRLPVNTHGGHLSEGYAHGINHVVEAVSQLRGQGGARQVPEAELALCTAQPGYVSGTTSALILRKDARR